MSLLASQADLINQMDMSIATNAQGNAQNNNATGADTNNTGANTPPPTKNESEQGGSTPPRGAATTSTKGNLGNTTSNGGSISTSQKSVNPLGVQYTNTPNRGSSKTVSHNEQSTNSRSVGESSNSQHSENTQSVSVNTDKVADTYNKFRELGYGNPRLIEQLRAFGFDPDSRKSVYDEERRRLNNISKLKAIGNAFQLFNEMSSLQRGASVAKRDIKDDEAGEKAKLRDRYLSDLSKYNDLMINSMLARDNAMFQSSMDSGREVRSVGDSNSVGRNIQSTNGSVVSDGTQSTVTSSNQSSSGVGGRGSGGGVTTHQVTVNNNFKTKGDPNGASHTSHRGNVRMTGSSGAYNNAYRMLATDDVRGGGRNNIKGYIRELLPKDSWMSKAGGIIDGVSESTTQACVDQVISALYGRKDYILNEAINQLRKEGKLGSGDVVRDVDRVKIIRRVESNHPNELGIIRNACESIAGNGIDMEDHTETGFIY